jgi:hypothetical protein
MQAAVLLLDLNAQFGLQARDEASHGITRAVDNDAVITGGKIYG